MASRHIKIAHVVAASENHVIGRDGGMPWHLSGDLKYFKRVTMGRPIIMGRKTFQSIGRPLPGRLNIIITRDASYAAEGVTVCHTMDDALSLARERAAEDGIDEVMIVGGGQIYADSIDLADRVYLTEVHASVDGDTVYPELSPDTWREVSREKVIPDVGDEPSFSFVILERNSN